MLIKALIKASKPNAKLRITVQEGELGSSISLTPITSKDELRDLEG
jgi:hypothetical protein